MISLKSLLTEGTLNEDIKRDIDKFIAKLNKQFPDQEYMVSSGGGKYVRITHKNRKGGQESAWGFIALVDNPSKGFQKGDLLKAAGYNTPAKTARGNILNGTAKYDKYSPKYLREESVNEGKKTVKDIKGLTKVELDFLAALINGVGTGQHPYADNSTIKGFTIDYVNKLLKKIKGKVPLKFKSEYDSVIPKLNEDVVNEGNWSKIMAGVKKGSQSGPWTIVVIKNKKVVHQEPVKYRDAIPAHYEDVKKKFRGSILGIEDNSGQMVYQERI